MSADSNSRRAGAFDIRRVIAFLIGLYGLIITIMGLGFTSDREIERSAGVNINLWAGVGMLVFAGAFLLWAWLRPIRVDESDTAEEQGQDTAGSE